MEPSPLEWAIRRDRMVALGGLSFAAALSWMYLLLGGGMEMDPTHSAMHMPWSVTDFVVMLIMWVVMMVAMMLPGAAPMILLFTTVSHKSESESRHFAPAGAFVLGYCIVWSTFGFVATVLQWQLDRLALLSPMAMGIKLDTSIGGIVLVAIGLYQVTPVKSVCLRHCRSPFHFLMDHWRPGTAGAVGMGMSHGLYCLGCCWMLMALLFVGGVMNLLWIAGIATFVLLEKTVPAGPWFARIAGGLLIGWGTFWLALP